MGGAPDRSGLGKGRDAGARRIKSGHFGANTVESDRDLANAKIGQFAKDDDPADKPDT
jgi:hypothetical protein